MSAFEKFKDFLGLEDEYDEEDDLDLEEDSSDQEEETSTSFSRPERSYSSSRVRYQDRNESSMDQERTRRSNIVSVNSSEKAHISIQEPVTYDDSPAILDDIMAGKVVVLNLEMLDVDRKHQVFDFVSGGVYALDANMQKVTKDIFVLAPEGTQIDGKLTDKIQTKSLYQL